MQINVLGTERRWRSYEDNVRLVEETLQPGETVCGVTCRRQARQGRLRGDA